MAWTDLLDAVLAVGKPGRAIHMRALRDNIVALAQGLAGAPKIQPDAISDNSMPGAKLSDGSVWGASKIAANSVTYGQFYVDSAFNAFIGQRIAALGINQIGTVALMRHNTAGATISAGSTYAASSLMYAGFQWDSSGNAAYGSATASPSPSGTWLALGHCNGTSGRYSTTLFMRVS